MAMPTAQLRLAPDLPTGTDVCPIAVRAGIVPGARRVTLVPDERGSVSRAMAGAGIVPGACRVPIRADACQVSGRIAGHAGIAPGARRVTLVADEGQGPSRTAVRAGIAPGARRVTLMADEGQGPMRLVVGVGIAPVAHHVTLVAELGNDRGSAQEGAPSWRCQRRNQPSTQMGTYARPMTGRAGMMPGARRVSLAADAGQIPGSIAQRASASRPGSLTGPGKQRLAPDSPPLAGAGARLTGDGAEPRLEPAPSRPSRGLGRGRGPAPPRRGEAQPAVPERGGQDSCCTKTPPGYNPRRDTA
jgi:hypothetical protein